MLFDLNREELVMVTDGLRRWVDANQKEMATEPPATDPDSVTARLLRGQNEKMDKLADRLWREAGKMDGDGEDHLAGWGVFVNSDLTEGRGFERIKALCKIEATALRLAKRANVQGSDGVVRKIRLSWHDGKFHGPVELTMPTSADEATQKMLDRRRSAFEKARALGLSTEDLDALQGS
jgi:hypothetical protein